MRTLPHDTVESVLNDLNEAARRLNAAEATLRDIAARVASGEITTATALAQAQPVPHRGAGPRAAHRNRFAGATR